MTRKNKKTDLSQLNNSQIKAVTTVNGMIQVGSVAGSGKTTVLTKRIAYMVNDLHIKPESIMCATFTNKAGKEMVDRLEKELNKGEVASIKIGTFHSIFYKIFKYENRLMNNPMMDCNLMTDGQAKGIIREIIEDFKEVEENNKNQVSTILKKINAYKMNLISPDAMLAQFLIEAPSNEDKLLLRVFEEYEKRKDSKKLIDFNDMLYKTYWMLVKYPRILEKYQNKIKYILVDEAQDNNKAQYALIEMIAEKNQNIFIVGDDDQSIYRFRGALSQLFIDFQKEHPETVLINLENNYRSLPFILESANNLIKNNTIRIKKELKPFRQYKENDDQMASVMNNLDEDDEASNIVSEINQLHKNGNKYNDMLVLYRTNAQARAMEDELIKNSIPYIVFNGISFYERAEVKDLIAYLRLATNPLDNESFKRIINVPNRYLGRKFIEDLELVAKNNNCGLYEALDYIKVFGKTYDNVQGFLNIMSKIKVTIHLMDCYSQNVSDIIEKIISETDYLTYLIKENGNEEDNIRIENIRSLCMGCQKFTDVDKFIEYVDIVTTAKYDDSIDTVKLMTIHKSKGLEYPIIFMIGVSEGLLPHKYAIEESTTNIEGIEEERRLCYVGITRAKNKLYVSSIQSFQGKILESSRFVREAFQQYL